MSQWQHILTAAEIEAYHNMTASLDPAFARREREWYESRTVSQLQSEIWGAWQANLPTPYQMARSYLALRAGANV